ncbi:hypothetical protein Tco_1469421 [Tanacetum coccineum]
MNFRSFMMEGMDGEFYFESEGGVGDGEGSSPSIRFVNNEASVIDDEPLNSAPPSQFVENIRDSYDALSKKYVVDEARNRKLGKSSKATGKRKQIAKSSGRETSQKARKVPSQASKAFGDPSDPLDVDIINKYFDIQGNASSSTIYMMDWPSMPFFNMKVLHEIPPSTLPQGCVES